jgi:hypothetical protein
MLCESEEVLPGQVAQVICAIAPGKVARGVYMDPPTAAAFTIERVDQLTPGEMHVLANLLLPGVCITVRNDGDRARRFRADVDVATDLEAMEDELAHVVDRDWAAAYDRARRAHRNGKERP